MLAATLLGLAACSARDAGWQRPHTSDAQRAADYKECRSLAKDAAGPSLGIDQDIIASRGNDWRNSGTYDKRVEQTNGSDVDTMSQILGTCMNEKGYEPR